MTRRNILLIVCLCLLAALTLAVPASAQEAPQEEVTDDEVNAVASRMYCPICENVPLDVCPTQACADWRAEIRSLLEQGRTEDEVRAYFVDHYGVRVLGEPPRQGFTALVWILPAVGLAVGALVLGRNLIVMRRAGLASQAAGRPATSSDNRGDAEYAARLEQELKDLTS